MGPRYELYIPNESDGCPFPIKWLDVHRKTETDLEDKVEKYIEDYWCNDENSVRRLSLPWVGLIKLSGR